MVATSLSVTQPGYKEPGPHHALTQSVSYPPGQEYHSQIPVLLERHNLLRQRFKLGF